MQPFENLNLAQFMTTAITNVFETMLAIDLEAAAEPENPPNDSRSEKVVGSVGLAGRVKGVVYVQFQDAFARTVTATMLGMTTEELGEAEVNDVIGELSNMIGGNFKSRLCDAGLSCQLSVPTVMRGEQLAISPQELGNGWLEEQVFRHQTDLVRLVVALKPGDC